MLEDPQVQPPSPTWISTPESRESIHALLGDFDEPPTDTLQGPVREGMEAIRATYRRQARRWVKENPSGGGMEGWAIAAYQVTHIDEHRRRHVDAHNQSRLGTASAAISDAGYSTVDEDAESAYTDVERREMISFPWLWAQGACFGFFLATG